MRHGRRRTLSTVCAVVAALMVAATGASAQADKREMKAREFYAAGHYQQALDVYVKLYAETLHPTYLRNIGRCYQNLGEPDKAISSFREYLRKAKKLSAEERKEIDVYIGEMQDLKRQRDAAAKPVPAAPKEPTPDTAPRNTGLLTPPPPAATTTAATGRDEAPAAEGTPVYERWWFWAGIGGVVVAGAAGLWAAGVFGAKDPPCGPARMCQ